MATGKASGVLVLDVDVKNGQPGAESLKRLEAEYGRFETMRVRTPSGGLHLYFKYPDGVQIRNCQLKGYPGIEVKGDGGAVTLPGSIYSNGAEYVLTEAKDLTVVLAGMSELMKNGHNGDHAAGTGNRNVSLTEKAGSMRRVGMEYEAIRAALMAENEKCDPPLAAAEVESIAKSVSRYDAADSLLTLRRTDSGNADRFVHMYGDLLRFCAEYGSWYMWDGNQWRKDKKRIVLRLGQEMVKKMYHLGAQIGDDKERAAFMQYVSGMDNLFKVKSAIEWATANPKVALTSDDLDSDQMLLNVQNGTFELASMIFREHRQADNITKVLPVTFDEKAECPRWQIFLDEVLNGDQALKVFMQQAIGYALTGDCREQCLFILHGTGANGKSTFIEIISELLGDYALRTPVETLLIKRGEGIPNDVARLKGARLIHSVETESGKRLAEGLVKAMTGGDTLVARFLHAEFFEFQPTFKIFLATNHVPIIRGVDHAIWRRIRLVPFNVTFAPEIQDKNLPRKLRTELPGILNWALEGCRDWQAHGLSTPPAVVAATQQYRTEMDTLGDFFAEYILIEKASETPSKIIYSAYRTYCEAAGENPVTRMMLGRQLEERGYRSKHTTSGTVWMGIRLSCQGI
jgi:putative DNA primase/helicase